MNQDDEDFLRHFFQQLRERPLDPAFDRRYVPLYEGPDAIAHDPVALLQRTIEWIRDPREGSVQLLSGFRGTGKSTELRRLRQRLKNKGYHVVLIDIEDYVNMTTRIDVSDFLIAIAGALGDGLGAADLLGTNPLTEGYWTRFVAFCKKTKIELPEATPGYVKLSLRMDPTFRQQIQERMSGHITALVKDVQGFITDCLQALRQKHGESGQLVILLDSVERIRGTSINALEVQASVETLFAGHHDKLRMPGAHMVYTVPAYMKVRYQSLGEMYDGGAIQIFPAVKVRHEATGDTHDGGVRALEKVLRSRGDMLRLFGHDDLIKKVILASGGHLRDLFRIVSEILRRTESLPVDAQVIDDALNQLRTEFLPIPDADAVWLARVAETHAASIADGTHLPDLARFLDTHVVLCYRDGPEWYDVHPLIKDIVVRQAQRLATPRTKTTRRRR